MTLAGAAVEVVVPVVLVVLVVVVVMALPESWYPCRLSPQMLLILLVRWIQRVVLVAAAAAAAVG
jgi:hypothetical protein